MTCNYSEEGLCSLFDDTPDENDDLCCNEEGRCQCENDPDPILKCEFFIKD